MMNTLETIEPQSQLVLRILQAAKGEIEGRTRIQKIVYLIEEIGNSSNFFYSYHHYGPYSEELTDTLNILKHVDEKIIEERRDFEDSQGFTAVFQLKGAQNSSSDQEASAESVSFEKMQQYVTLMKKKSSTCLEIAATIHWLICKRKVQNWEDELVILKGNKARPEILQQSRELLEELGIPIETLH